MSMLMWDMLTGGAPYKEILKRALHPMFWIRFLGNIIVSLVSANDNKQRTGTTVLPLPQNVSNLMETNSMDPGALGKVYQNGEIIVRQGETGDCMYVIQEGFVEVFFESDGQQVQLNVLGKNEFFGEMAIFNQEMRTASVRALGSARILAVDHKNLLRYIHEDPSLTYRLMKKMSNRINRLSKEVAALKQISSK